MAPKRGTVLIFFNLFALFALGIVHGANYFIDSEGPENCKSGEADDVHQYFDISQLKCLDCAQSRTYQTVSHDDRTSHSPCSACKATNMQGCDFTAKALCDPCIGLKCVCQNGFRVTQDFGGARILCEPCPDGKVASSDGWECVACGNGLDPVLNKCNECMLASMDGQPEIRNIAVERLLNGSWTSTPNRTCETCAANTAPNTEGKQCFRCNQVLSVLPTQSDCICPAENQVGGLCFQNPADIVEPNPQIFAVNFAGDEFESAYFREKVQAAAAMCQTRYSNLTACQELANLCTLILHTRDNEGSTGSEDACALYLLYAEAAGNTITDDWPINMPWLYYLEETGEEVLTDEGITTVFKSSNMSLDIRAAVFNLNGSYEGISSVTGGLIQLCPNSQSILDAAYDFGRFYEQSCNIKARDFWDEEKYPLEFYDLYLAYRDGETSADKLYGVPVLVTNYGGNGGSNRADWQLVRRFFLVDNISGKRYDAESTDTTTSTDKQPIRYAQDITIHVTLQNGATEGLIYPPYIEITYAVATNADYESNTQKQLTFKVNYRTDTASTDRQISIAIGVLGAFAAVYSAIQTWGWSRRSGRLGIDFVSIIKFLVFSMGNIANVFFVVMLGSALWWVIFYKRQKTISIIVPNRDQEGQFVAYLASAFVLKFFQLLHIIICQVTIDIFFIDWERPKGKVMSSNDAGQKGKESPVSIWRTYFAANEWNEIQTSRKINHMFQIFAVVLFLSVIRFENLATKDPFSRFGRSTDEYYSPDSRIFRFAIAGMTYLCIAIIQWLFFAFIYERFIEDKVRQYVDLCSMSNISVFILETGQFGYYIHGRSVHGRADTGMREMAENLKREEENLCGQRGLIPNTEKQTFQIAVPAKLRAQYDKVLMPIYAEQAAAGAARVPASPGNGHIDVHTDKCLQAYSILNRFLQAFVDHSLRDIDYIVKDKTFMENILNMEFQDPLEQGFFYNDSGSSFESVLFFGHENCLIIFEILFFAIVDLLAENFILAAVLTYIFMEILGALRDGLGRRNLAKKTLVDKRFLI